MPNMKLLSAANSYKSTGKGKMTRETAWLCQKVIKKQVNLYLILSIKNLKAGSY